MKNEMKCSLSNAYTQRTVTSGVTTWLNGTGFTQFYLPPTRLSMNEMNHILHSFRKHSLDGVARAKNERLSWPSWLTL